MQYRGLMGVLLALAIVMSACAGSESVDGPTSTESDVGTAEPNSTTTAQTDGNTPAPESGDTRGTATIVVDGTSTDFTIEGCAARTDDPVVSARGDASNGSDSDFDLLLPLVFEDWDRRLAHELRFAVDGRFFVVAGPGSEDHATFDGDRVDSMEISPVSDHPQSFHATGTFLAAEMDGRYGENEIDPGNLVTGSFDVTCDPKS